MTTVKLTKNELRVQEKKQTQLKKYLPTLQLKKALLQAEVIKAKEEIALCQTAYKQSLSKVEAYAMLLSEEIPLSFQEAAKVSSVKKITKNIAGVPLPYFESASFEAFEYSLFDLPPWVDTAISDLRLVSIAKIKIAIAEEKKSALDNELRRVSIRVNLFEKILIPRAQTNIKKIKVFLGDQDLAAVSRAKSAKNKIELKRVPLK